MLRLTLTGARSPFARTASSVENATPREKHRWSGLTRPGTSETLARMPRSPAQLVPQAEITPKRFGEVGRLYRVVRHDLPGSDGARFVSLYRSWLGLDDLVEDQGA